MVQLLLCWQNQQTIEHKNVYASQQTAADCMPGESRPLMPVLDCERREQSVGKTVGQAWAGYAQRPLHSSSASTGNTGESLYEEFS
jgi:hypothetical protein